MSGRPATCAIICDAGAAPIYSNTCYVNLLTHAKDGIVAGFTIYYV
jgi:hypothetical protein